MNSSDLFLFTLLMILLTIFAEPNTKSAFQKNYNYNNLQYSGYQYGKPAGHSQYCGKCEQGLICSSNRTCICPNDYVYSSDLNGCVNCPLPWVLVKGLCIKYFENAFPLSWNKSREKCQALGGDLMDVNFETFFDYAEFFADSLSNNSNFPLFYVGVKAENPSYFTYKSVFSQNQIPVFSNLWHCNFVNNYICACENKFDKEITCSLVGNSLNFNNTQKCKRCSYVNYDSPASGVNATLRLFPVDCDFPDINITNYVCQKAIQYSPYKNNIFQVVSNYQKLDYHDKKCKTTSLSVASIKCYNDRECQNNLVCYDYYCRCPFGYHLINNTICKRCPIEWIYREGSCYYVSKEKLNWTASLEACFAKQSSLIGIDALPSYPSKLFGLLRCIDSDDNYWIGAIKNQDTDEWINIGKNVSDLNSFAPDKPWFENNQYSCNSESRDYYFSNHGLDDVMKANGNSKSIKSGSKIELNNYICEIKLDQTNGFDYASIYEKIINQLECDISSCLNNGTCNVTNAGSFVCLRYMLNNLEFSLDNSIITLWRIIKINMNVTNLFSRVNNLSIKAYFTSETAFNNLKPIIAQLISDISSIYISSIDDPLFADNLIQIIEQALNQINIIIPNS